MKDNTNLIKIGEYAKDLGFDIKYQKSRDDSYSDDLYCKFSHGVILINQIHKYEPDAPYGGYKSVYYADVRAECINHIGMYEYEDILELIKRVKNDTYKDIFE